MISVILLAQSRPEILSTESREVVVCDAHRPAVMAGLELNGWRYVHGLPARSQRPRGCGYCARAQDAEEKDYHLMHALTEHKLQCAFLGMTGEEIDNALGAEFARYQAWS